MDVDSQDTTLPAQTGDTNLINASNTHSSTTPLSATTSQSATVSDSQSQVDRNTGHPAGPVYAPFSNHFVHPPNYGPRAALPSIFTPVPSPIVSFPISGANHESQNAFYGAPLQNSSTAGIREISNISFTQKTGQAMQLPVHSTIGHNPLAAPSPNMRPTTTWTSPVAGNPAAPENLVGQHPMFANHPFHAAPMGQWHQNSQPNVPPQQQFVPYPSNVTAPFPGVLHPSISFPGTQPPSANPAVFSGAPPITSSTSALEMRGNYGMMLEPPPGTDSVKNTKDIKRTTDDNEQSSGWTSHRTEAGVIYYYNTLTGESTYKKPAGFKEITVAKAHPTPASWEKVAGTDWVAVITNDGKNYYYNSITKQSSWQIPPEVLQATKKQDGVPPNEHSTIVVSDTPTDKESVLTRLDTPAINPENNDLTSPKSMPLPASSSALDSIKKKLQDSATLDTISLNPAPVLDSSELNGSVGGESTIQDESNKEKQKDDNAKNNIPDSSSDSDDPERGPTKEQCIFQFKEMLKERGVLPFSKWEKELPKIVFDSRFKAISSHSMRRSLFDHYVKTRAEEERKEKRAAQRAAVDGFKQLLQEASEDIDQNTNYNTFKSKWGNDARFKALNHKDIEVLLNERVIPLKKAAEEKAQAIHIESTKLFKSMFNERTDINTSTRWSKVKDSLRSDPRYKAVKHEDREMLFNEYISELNAAGKEEEREAKIKRLEQEKLRERERELRKRKEREEEEIERIRLKVRRKEAVSSYQALLMEVIKDPQTSWTESRPKLEKDPQGRARNPDLESSELEKLFREHVNMLLERCANEFKELLAEALNDKVASQESEDSKTVFNSWSTAKELLRNDPRYIKMPRKEREILWRRHTENMMRKQKDAKGESDEGKVRESHPRPSRRRDNR